MRILFIGDAVTLSHVARPLVLARAAAEAGHDVTFAFDARYNAIIGDLPFRTIPLVAAFSREVAAQRLKDTAPIFNTAVLGRYVREDLRLIRLIRPDLVVGDMRQSLAISARVAGVPYVAIMNAHWSPYSPETMTPSEHPLRTMFGARTFEQVFHILFPLGSAYYTLPSNAVRTLYGRPVESLDIRDLFCDADHVLYPDVPQITPTIDKPDHHRYLGPIVWVAETALPHWWEDVPRDRPVATVNLGSSGEPELLGAIIAGLRAENLTVIVATAGRTEIAAEPPHLFTTQYLPSDAAAERSDLVVCTGGCMPVHPILSRGCPILSLPSNLDQLMTARIFTRFGAGEHIEMESKVTAPAVRSLAHRILKEPRYRDAAERCALALASLDAPSEFVAFLDELRRADNAPGTPANASGNAA